MKPISALFALAAMAVSVSLHAAPPASHPAQAAAADMMHAPHGSDAELTQKGKVVSSVDATEYTYIEVLQGKNTLWIAAPKTTVKKDSVIRFEEGAVMTNFRSKLLNRTFPSVMFVSRVVPANDKQ